MKDKEILKRIVSYPLRNKLSYFSALFLFASQDFIFLAYVSLIQFYAVNIIESNKMNEIVKVAGLAILLYAILTIILAVGMLLIDYVNIRTDNLLKHEMLKQIIYRKSRDVEVSDVSSRLINDAGIVSYFSTTQIGTLLMPVVSFIGVSIITFIVNVKIGLISVGVMIIPVIYNKLIMPQIKKISSRIVILNSEYLKKVRREIQSISTIKLYNLVNKQIDCTKVIRDEVRSKQILKSSLFSIRTLISNISNVVATLIVMTFAIKLYNLNSIRLAEIIIIPQLLSGMISGIEGICSFSLNMQQPIASAKRIFEIIDEEKCEDIVSQSNESIDYSLENAVEIKNLNFGYDDKAIVSEFNCNIKKDNITCLFGPIGCGKSTIVKLILGLLNQEKGSIKVFNQDKALVGEETWFNNFSLVEQEPSLFNLSIEENILLGDINKEKDLDKINEIFKLIGLDELLAKLPNGIKTRVGERGTSLSGGQKQLVALARALYSDAPVVILDEFSAAMDKSIEEKVLGALAFYKKNKTFIMISHRKSCLDIADTVIRVA